MNTTTREYDTTRWRNRSSGRIGSLARLFDEDERGEQRGRRGQPRQHHGRRPADRNQQGRDAAKQQRRAEPVYFRGGCPGAGRIRQRDHDRRENAQRQIQIEDPAPGQRVRDVAADQRAGDRRDAPDAAEDRLRPCALLERVQLADDRHAERDDRAGAQPLDRAEDDELRHRGRRARERGSQDEDGNAGEIQPPASIEIRQPSPDRHRSGRRQQVCGKHPAVVREPAERRDHRRHGGSDDGCLERAEAHAEQQAGGDRLAAALADRHRRQPVRHLSSVPRAFTAGVVRVDRMSA